MSDSSVENIIPPSSIGKVKESIMWITKHSVSLLVLLMTVLLYDLTSALDVDNKSNVATSDIIRILSNDAMATSTTTKKPPTHADDRQDHEDMKSAGTVTSTNSEPAPEYYRGIPASDVMRAYDRYGVGAEKGSWLSLDKESLYKNPYIANAYSKLTNGGSTLTPSVSSLMNPNSSYRDRYGE